jgi:hypothetical protein
MYGTLLALHSLTRWLFRSYRGWLLRSPYLKFDNIVRHITTTVAHLQLILGVWLYFISPIVAYFLHHFATAVHERAIRFFGMEHVTMMLIGITLITLGSARSKRQTNDLQKFKTMAIWLTVALLVILSSVPWSFSPLISRPNFRSF